MSDCGTENVVLGAFSAPEARATPWAEVMDFERKYGAHLTSAEGGWYRLGEAVMAGDVRYTWQGR